MQPKVVVKAEEATWAADDMSASIEALGMPLFRLYYVPTDKRVERREGSIKPLLSLY